jgi:hypothetical protein
MGWFGPGKDEVWQQLCDEIGGEFVFGGMWKGSSVRFGVGPWTLVLDTYTESTGETHTTYTRLRAPFLNPGGFRFQIHRKSVLSGLGKMLGMQDIEVGDLEFDDAFIIKGNDDGIVRELLASAEVRQLIAAQPRIRLEIKDNEGWFGTKFPDDVDELHFLATGVIKDVDLLKSLFKLFAATLERLCRIGVSTRQPPGVTL